MINLFLRILFLYPFVCGFDYFDSDIDYWKDKNKYFPEEAKKSEPKKILKEQKDSEWKKILNPENDEFFKEGEYTPPAAFMKVIRHPSDENMKNWFKLIDMKNELSHRLQSRMVEYRKAHPQIPQGSHVAIEKVKESAPVPESSRYRFRLYVDSHCPHCKRMLATMETLQSQGFFVELKQVDDGPLTQFAPTLPIEKAGKGELAQKDISSVPVLFVGDMNKKVVYRIGGYKTSEQIFNAIQTQKAYQ